MCGKRNKMAVDDNLTFAFNGNDESPERARKRRAVAEAMMSGGVQTPHDMGTGIASLGHALAQRKMQRGAFPTAPTAPAGAAVPTGMEQVGNFLGRTFGVSRGGLY
jgi:hypothetical protein